MNYFSILICLIILTSSCGSFRKEVDFEDDQFPTSLVINAFPSSEDSLRPSITLSQDVLTQIDQFENIQDATMKLFKNSNLIEELNGTNLNGEYVFADSLEENAFYQIEVSHPSYEDIRAETFIPAKASNMEAIGTLNDDGVTVQLSFDDSPSADFYRLIMFEDNFIIGWETNSEYFEIDPFEGSSYFYRDGFFSDEGFKDGRANLDFDLSSFSTTGNYKAFLICCSEDYLNYYQSRFAWEESDGSGLFTEPVQIFTNIEKGLGIFAGYSVAEVDVVF